MTRQDQVLARAAIFKSQIWHDQILARAALFKSQVWHDQVQGNSILVSWAHKADGLRLTTRPVRLFIGPLLLLHSQVYLWGSSFWVRFFAFVTVFFFQPRGSYILSLWMVHAGCVFVAGIHRSRTARIFWVCMMECMCAQTRPWFKLSSREFLGNGVRTHVNPKGKIPSTQGPSV